MGNKLDADTQVSYKTLKNENIILTLKELAGEKNFPKVPTDREVNKMFADWHKSVKLDSK